MDEDPQKIQALLRLKRYEQPPQGYFEDFLTEFQCRQRSEMLSRSSRSLFIERLGTYISGLGNQRWLYGAGAAYAAVAVGLYVIQEDAGHGAGAAAAGAAEQGSSLWDGRISLGPDFELAPARSGSSNMPATPAVFDLDSLPPAPQRQQRYFLPEPQVPSPLVEPAHEAVVREY